MPTIRPVSRHRSTNSVDSDPAVKSLRSDILGTRYGFEAKFAASLMTSETSAMDG